MSPDRHLMQWPLLLAVGVLTCLVMAVFCPLLNFEFVNFDVKSSVVANPHVHGLTVENVKYIFTTRCIDSYYPIRSLTYATDYSLWGLNPRGYKLTNVLLHWTNVMLVFGLLLRLLGGNDKPKERAPPQQDIAAAAFAAAMFAIHPLVVEPVAWVAGREELLMTLGALGCFHLHLSARRQAAEGAAKNAVRIRHALATGCCLLACLSNAVGAVIPLLVTAWDVMTLRPLKWARVFSSTAPLWLIGIATIASKILGSNEPLAAQSSPVLSSQQLMLIAKVVWLNFKSLAWPVELALSYGAYDKFLPHSFLETEVILGGLVLAAAAFGLWILRRETLPLFGLIWFGLALAPSLHIMPHHIIHADRLLYLSLAGLAITIASGIQLLNKRLKVRAFRIGTCLVGLLVLGLLCYRSTQQVQTCATASPCGKTV